MFRETTNPPIATGDGVMLGWFAGARVTDLEFVQFHPTALDVPGAPRFLLSEALRGEGAQLLNADGERFMTRYEPAGELASRDLVSRAIVREQRRTGRPVYLSMAHLDPEWTRARFPTIAEACTSIGLDLGTDRIPVGPAAHYVMGGVETDLWGRTTLHWPLRGRGGRVHGRARRQSPRQQFAARRPGVRRAGRAGDAAARPMMSRPFRCCSQAMVPGHPPRATATVDRLRQEADVRGLMWNSVGLWREGAVLQHGHRRARRMVCRAWTRPRPRRRRSSPSDA